MASFLVDFGNGQEGLWDEYTKRGWISEYLPVFNKNGSISLTRQRYVTNDFTLLYRCELCGKVSTPKRVHHRNDLWGWDVIRKGKREFVESEVSGLLCMGCANIIRRQIIAKEKQKDDLERLINDLVKLCKEIKNERPII